MCCRGWAGRITDVIQLHAAHHGASPMTAAAAASTLGTHGLIASGHRGVGGDLGVDRVEPVEPVEAVEIRSPGIIGSDGVGPRAGPLRPTPLGPRAPARRQTRDRGQDLGPQRHVRHPLRRGPGRGARPRPTVIPGTISKHRATSHATDSTTARARSPTSCSSDRPMTAPARRVPPPRRPCPSEPGERDRRRRAPGGLERARSMSESGVDSGQAGQPAHEGPRRREPSLEQPSAERPARRR